MEPPIDVYSLAERLEIDIEELHLSSSVTGMLVREAHKRWLIILNSRVSDLGRRRFTIAHELAHWTLHRPQLRRSSLELAGVWEREADEFASHLLLPPDRLHEWISSFGLVDVERHFGVSKAAAAAALRGMGYRVWW